MEPYPGAGSRGPTHTPIHLQAGAAAPIARGRAQLRGQQRRQLARQQREAALAREYPVRLVVVEGGEQADALGGKGRGIRTGRAAVVRKQVASQRVYGSSHIHGITPADSTRGRARAGAPPQPSPPAPPGWSCEGERRPGGGQRRARVGVSAGAHISTSMQCIYLDPCGPTGPAAAPGRSGPGPPAQRPRAAAKRCWAAPRAAPPATPAPPAGPPRPPRQTAAARGQGPHRCLRAGRRRVGGGMGGGQKAAGGVVCARTEEARPPHTRAADESILSQRMSRGARGAVLACGVGVERAAVAVPLCATLKEARGEARAQRVRAVHEQQLQVVAAPTDLRAGRGRGGGGERVRWKSDETWS
jgi:hypothetical protein